MTRRSGPSSGRPVTRASGVRRRRRSSTAPRREAYGAVLGLNIEKCVSALPADNENAGRDRWAVEANAAGLAAAISYSGDGRLRLVRPRRADGGQWFRYIGRVWRGRGAQ